MTLEFQNFPVEFGGVDAKSDPKKVIPGKLLSLQNGVFSSPGQIRKRNGYTALSTGVLGGGSISSASGLGSLGSELLLFGNNLLYSYSPTLGGWASKGALNSAYVTTNSITRNTYQQSAPDMAQNGNLQCFAWEDSRGGIRYSVLDTSTGVFLVQDASVTGATTVSRPKVIPFGINFLIFVANTTGAIGYYYLTTSNPTFLQSFQSLAATGNTTNPNYDVCVANNSIYIAYNSSTANTVTIRKFAGIGFIGSSSDITADAASGCVNVFADSSNSRINICLYQGTSVKLITRDWNTLASAGSTFTVETIANVSHITCVQLNSAITDVFYTVTSTPSTNNRVRLCQVVSYGSGSPADFMRSVALAGKAALYSVTGPPPVQTVYVPLVYVSALQPTYFVADSGGNIIARIFAGTAGGLPTRPTLPETSSPATLTYQFAATVVDELTTNPTTTTISSTTTTPVYTQTGVNSVRLNLADTINGFQSIPLANNLHIGGGFLSMYDGASSVEHGFHVYPEGVQTAVAPIGGALQVPSGVNTANIETSATYEWMDNEGQIHQSSPSVPNAATLGPTASGSLQAGFINSDSGVTIGQQSAATTNYSLAGSFVVTGCSTTNASTAITVGGGGFLGAGGIYSNNQRCYIYPGMSVSGPGISAGTYLVATAGGYVLSQNATATNSNVTLTFTTNYQNISSAVNAGTATVGNLSPVQSYTVSCSGITTGSSAVTVLSTSQLVVGQAIQIIGVPGAFNSGTTITAINTTTNVITLSNTANASFLGWVTMSVFYQSTGTITSGSANITGCSAAAVAYAAARTGGSYAISGTGIPANTFITAASGTTITMSANATASSGVTFTVWFSGECQFVPGQSVSGTGIPAGATIASTSVAHIVLSAAATATASNVLITASGCFALVNTLPTLRLTAKQSSRSPVSLVTYRTPANGSVFYRASSASSPLYNSATVDILGFTDTSTDLTLVGGPTLYTTGGVLENGPPNPVSEVTSHKGRLFVLDSTSPNSFWYSKQVTSGSPVQFSPFLVTQMDSTGGNISGFASIDDRLILFKQNAIYVMTGDGPDATGSSNTYANPVLLPTDCGCQNPRSIVITPLGVMFQGAKGIMLLDRSLSVQYIGRDVESLVQASSVTSSRLVQVQNQVRFTLANGTAIVYDTLVGQWSTFTNHNAVDAAFYLGAYSFVNSSGVVWVETPGTYTDAGSFIALSITTSWLQLAGMQGFQRVRRALVFGDYESAHNLNMSVYVDFDGVNVVESVTIPVSGLASGSLEQNQIRLTRQKCEAIQFTISDSQNGAAGESLRISGLTLELGIKRGPQKLAASNTYG